MSVHIKFTVLFEASIWLKIDLGVNVITDGV